jgi:ankyrin repeat protein
MSELNEKLLQACKNKNPTGVRDALKSGANPNVKDKDGKTPLMYACQVRSYTIFSTLVRHKANIHEEDNEGKNILNYAVKYDMVPAVRELRRFGAKVELGMETANEKIKNLLK